MKLSNLTKEITDEDLLAVRLEEFVRLIIPILVYIYLCGVVAGEVTMNLIEKISKQFVYQVNQDDNNYGIYK